MHSLGSQTWIWLSGFVVILGCILKILVEERSVLGRFWRAQRGAVAEAGYFAQIKSSFRAVRDTRTLIEKGYKEFSKQGQAFVLRRFGNNPLLILPPERIEDLVRKSDKEVDLHSIHHEQLASYWTSRKEIYGRPTHLRVVRRRLNRSVSRMMHVLDNEVGTAFQHELGSDPETWETVPLYSSCIRIVNRTTNLAFVGKELCRSAEFLDHSWQYTTSVFTAAARINLWPALFRPLVARWLTKDIKRHFKACSRVATPAIRRRVHELCLRRLGEDSGTPTGEHEDDALTWIIEEVLDQDRANRATSDLEPSLLCHRILALNGVAVHTTAIAITNVLLDLFSSPDTNYYVAALRNECTTVLRRTQNIWTEGTSQQLVLLDSTIKESMRLSVRRVGMHRIVTAPNGIDLGHGFQIPCGVRVAFPNHAAQRDEAIYDDADQFRAFRFAREPFPDLERSTDAIQDQDPNQKLLVTPSRHFLVWGYGRHACPGRFFAAHIMKMMLAHILLGYDVQSLPERPQGLERNEFPIPSLKASLMVRKRDFSKESP